MPGSARPARRPPPARPRGHRRRRGPLAPVHGRTELGAAHARPARDPPRAHPADLNDAAALFEAYAARLGVDLAYQDFATELASLPGKYAPPTGALLLAHNPAPIGCVALRALTDGACEMKRLYVAPDARGLGLGRALAEAILAEGRRLGYREMRLDTLPTMGPAIDLYRDLGFRPTAPYYDTPIRGTLFLSCTL